MQTYVNRATATVAHSKSRRYTFITKVSLFAYIITFSHFTWNYIMYWNEIRWSFIWFRSLWYCLFLRLFYDTKNYSSFLNFFYRIFQLHINMFEYKSHYNAYVQLFLCYVKTMLSSNSNLPLLPNEKKL